MALRINCFTCDKELEEQGGLYFAPPELGECMKFHICQKCNVELMHFIVDLKKENAEKP